RCQSVRNENNMHSPLPMNISRYLKASAELAAVAEHAERLLELQHLFEAIAPPALAQNCRIANFKQGVLVILATNAFFAAKLRQFLPSPADEFCHRGCQVTATQVAVQARPPPVTPADDPPVAPAPAARAGLKAFADAAGDARTRRAVERLLDTTDANGM